MKKQIVLGTFNAEKYWRDAGLATLPELQDKSAAAVVAAMDELLFPLCGKSDVLITRRALDPEFKGYLGEAGFDFSSNHEDLETDAGTDDAGERCVFSLLGDRLGSESFGTLLGGATVLCPYAVLPETAGLEDRLGIRERQVDVRTVKKVNSKEYSHTL
ncbi:MAG TPA: hypothetical protein ENN69_00790, partial [Spirochaetia bacterium]|nr:hypothetical protein [Spirochaetia bacterium]